MVVRGLGREASKADRFLSCSLLSTDPTPVHVAVVCGRRLAAHWSSWQPVGCGTVRRIRTAPTTSPRSEVYACSHRERRYGLNVASQWREGVMKSAFECFQHAARCEEQAYHATTEVGRALLLETAKHWRTLGGQAKAAEANELQERLGASPANPAVRPQVKRPRAARKKATR